MGRDLTEDRMKIITERVFSFTAAAERESVRDAIEKLCYIGLDYDTEFVTNSDGVSLAVPVYESFTLHHAIPRLAGRDFAKYLMKNLTERGFSFTASAGRVLEMSQRNCAALAIYCNKQGEDLRAPRRKHHHCWRQTFPMRVVPAKFHR